VELAEEGGALVALVQGVVDDAGGELGDNAEEDDEADGLVGGVEVRVLNDGVSDGVFENLGGREREMRDANRPCCL
jgi:hypothetical protein